jgi:hypothetical protein
MIPEYSLPFDINNINACKLQHAATEENVGIFCNDQASSK